MFPPFQWNKQINSQLKKKIEYIVVLENKWIEMELKIVFI